MPKIPQIMNKRVLIFASNLRGGGGVQVAASVIEELSAISSAAVNISVLASTEVDSNVKLLNIDTSRFYSYEVRNFYGVSTLWSGLSNYLKNFDGILTVFGPLYIWSPTTLSVVGFAQPWIVYPQNEIFAELSKFKQLTLRLKYWIQSRFFSRADVLVVELEHVKLRLLNAGLKDNGSIKVVHNCISTLYRQPERWLSVEVPPSRACLRLGFLGRNYPHKNTKIIPAVRFYLERNYGMSVDFYVTFNDQEWNNCTSEFRASVKNVGALSVAQCPAFYSEMDGIIFPSLLECFSATPLEAMAMERPLFAADRPFIHDVCGEHAHYFDPTSPKDAAACIAEYFFEKEKRGLELGAAREHALSFSTAPERARKLMACMAEALGQEPHSTRKSHEHA